MQSVEEFLLRHGQSLSQLNWPEALKSLHAFENLPMNPSHVSLGSSKRGPYTVRAIDIGGTNLRTALVSLSESGEVSFSDLRVTSVPGLALPISEEEFYRQVASFADLQYATHEVRVSYAYNMESLPGPDAKPIGWCKEIQISDCAGISVADQLRRAAGRPDLNIKVINDAVANMLSGLPFLQSGESLMGLIVGSGFNICATVDGQIVNTEVGESKAFALSDFERCVVEESENPETAWAEKQTAGKYLLSVMRYAFEAAAAEGLIPEVRPFITMDYPEISEYIATHNTIEAQLFAALIKRAAYIVAISTSTFMTDNTLIVLEGSLIKKLYGYRAAFEEGLRFVNPNARYRLVEPENPCLAGIALI